MLINDANIQWTNSFPRHIPPSCQQAAAVAVPKGDDAAADPVGGPGVVNVKVEKPFWTERKTNIRLMAGPPLSSLWKSCVSGKAFQGQPVDGQEVEKALAKARAALAQSDSVQSPKALMETDFGKAPVDWLTLRLWKTIGWSVEETSKAMLQPPLATAWRPSLLEDVEHQMFMLLM